MRARRASEDAVELVEAILGPDGALSRLLPAFEHRPQQVEAGSAIAEAMAQGRHCLVEAGTGVGKSLAYLSAILTLPEKAGPVVISTQTIGLQSQLAEKDIPLAVQAAPGSKPRVVVAKGRGNYLCLRDLDAAGGDIFHDAEPQFAEIKRWAAETRTGDVAELPFTYSGWSDLGARGDTCTNMQCRYFDRCFYFRNRRETAKADIVIANHALYFSDLALRSLDADRTVLPNHDYVIFDEAHHLEDAATSVFGAEAASWRIPYVVDRIERLRGIQPDTARLDALRDLNIAMFDLVALDKQEYFLSELPSGALDRAKEASEAAAASLEALAAQLRTVPPDAPEAIRDRAEVLACLCMSTREDMVRALTYAEEGFIAWGETRRSEGPRRRAAAANPIVSVRSTPTDISNMLREQLWERIHSAVLVSATLADTAGFGYIRGRLGLNPDVMEAQVGSPFDYERQAVLYVPRAFPAPPRTPKPDYTRLLTDEIEAILRVTEGRALVLFTSHRMLTEAYETLKNRLPYPLFRQGTKPAGQLVADFRASDGGCLFGTSTFWEGVDVPGEALSVVIIDKLPFAVPDSPIQKSRADAVEQRGGSSFGEFTLPQTLIRLKQGLGRLIRTKTDCGAVCILDSRLANKSYGWQLVRSMPPMRKAATREAFEKVWREITATEA